MIRGIQGISLFAAFCLALAANLACEKAEKAPPAAPAPAAKPASGKPEAEKPRDSGSAAPHGQPAAGDAKPAAQPPAPAKPETPARTPVAATAIEGGKLALNGLTMVVPASWTSQPITPGPMPPVAVLSLPKAEGDAEDGVVRITYFPGMKGRDDMNIDRWCAQVTKANGQPHTREEAKLNVVEQGNVRIKTVDLTGDVKLTMAAAPKSGWRMIAGIVDHPQGPHFVVAAGGVKTVEKWEGDIHAFLKSASVN